MIDKDIEEGINFYKDGDYNKSKEIFFSKYETDKENPVVNKFIALILLDEKDQKNADVLNYLGYSLRKTGNFEKAEKFYLEGLKLDAGHLGINEYLGELYVQTGRIELAKKRLEVLQGCNCEEYEELKELIEKN